MTMMAIEPKIEAHRNQENFNLDCIVWGNINTNCMPRPCFCARPMLTSYFLIHHIAMQRKPPRALIVIYKRAATRAAMCPSGVRKISTRLSVKGTPAPGIPNS